jgi:hypothetical protein
MITRCRSSPLKLSRTKLAWCLKRILHGSKVGSYAYFCNITGLFPSDCCYFAAKDYQVKSHIYNSPQFPYEYSFRVTLTGPWTGVKGAERCIESHETWWTTYVVYRADPSLRSSGLLDGLVKTIEYRFTWNACNEKSDVYINGTQAANSRLPECWASAANHAPTANLIKTIIVCGSGRGIGFGWCSWAICQTCSWRANGRWWYWTQHIRLTGDPLLYLATLLCYTLCLEHSNKASCLTSSWNRCHTTCPAGDLSKLTHAPSSIWRTMCVPSLMRRLVCYAVRIISSNRTADNLVMSRPVVCRCTHRSFREKNSFSVVTETLTYVWRTVMERRVRRGLFVYLKFVALSAHQTASRCQSIFQKQ